MGKEAVRFVNRLGDIADEPLIRSSPSPPGRPSNVSHHFLMMADPREGGAACPNCRGACPCSGAATCARPVYDARWVVVTERTLTMTMLGLRSPGREHLTYVQCCCAGGCYAT